MSVEMLASAWRERASVLSVGLEPCAEYLPVGGPFAPDISGYERWLMAVAESSAPYAAAYKFNVAFFEALGPDGWAMLKRVRERLPRGVMVIADAKRGDIGTTAKRYAQATFEWLGADAVTLNPLMGRDSAEPFLAYGGKVCYYLCLTSNPGSRDFLQRHELYLDIAREVPMWGEPARCGLVVGATHPSQVASIRAAAPHSPLLIPGVGAQGGEIESVAGAGRYVPRSDAREAVTGFVCSEEGCAALFDETTKKSKERAASATQLDTGWKPVAPEAGLLFHVTRGVLASADESAGEGAFRDAVAAKCRGYRDRMAAALGVSVGIGTGSSERSTAHA